MIAGLFFPKGLYAFGKVFPPRWETFLIVMILYSHRGEKTFSLQGEKSLITA